MAQEFFLDLEGKGAFEKKTSTQFYDEEHKQFLADRYVMGTCPKCHFDKAYGDQCESCGSSLNPEDLINPLSTLSGKPPVMKETYHWYLPMGKEEGWLRDWIENGVLDGKQHHDPKRWKKQVVGQCLSWIDGKLGDRAITRDLEWGVKVPLEGADGKVLYVWLDAPIGYISATKQWAIDHKKDWKTYWQDDSTRLIHFIGKDNIVFHCLIFPIILKLKGDYILPQNVPANEFLNLEGQKISTSRNWAVWLDDYLNDFPGKQDELRYVLTAISPESRDSEFTWKDFQARVNNELVAILGNFVNRCLVLTQKYYHGQVPEATSFEKVDENVLKEIGRISLEMEDAFNSFRFRDALMAMMNLARAGNKYLADEEPWKKVKEDPNRVQTIMHVALQICSGLAIVMEPLLPGTSASLKTMLNKKDLAWDDLKHNNLLSSGHQLGQAALLFEKIEDATIEAQIRKLEGQSNQSKQVNEEKGYMDFETFTKMELLIGSILEAERVEGSKKLLKLKVDLGNEVRTIMSGIAEHYQPEQVIGQQVSVLANLAPRKIMGVESQGMILMAEDESGKLVFVQPSEKVGSGSKIS
jgi:methionyl-tRNA synthetase